MSWTQEEVDRVLVEARKRVMTDKAFRKLVVASPQKAIEQVSGKRVPAGLKIKVVESDPNYDLSFVLPRYVGGELSSDQLERVAGGLCGTDYGPCQGVTCNGQASRGE